MQDDMIIKVRNRSGFELPEYKTPGSAGMDLQADLDGDVVLKPMERKLIPTGLFIELPNGLEVQIRPRSGLSINHGITLVNCVGTVDSDYRGEIMVPVINLGADEYTIRRGDRIAQMVVSSYVKAKWSESDDLSDTGRAHGGFGSTGKNG